MRKKRLVGSKEGEIRLGLINEKTKVRKGNKQKPIRLCPYNERLERWKHQERRKEEKRKR